MSRNGRHFVIIAVLIAVSTVLTYLLLTAIYQLPQAASAEAGPIDQMFRVHFILISLLFSLIVVFIVYSIVVFRHRPEDGEASGAFIHGNTGLEIAWTIIPLIIVIALGVYGAFVLSDITSAEPNELVVKVTGRQWSWVFSYPDHEEVGLTDQLILPVNRPVLLEMTSSDVIHSFWVPEFRVKQDLLPGTVTSLHITPDVEGAFKIRCAEMCGLSHAYMLSDVIVMAEADFDQWVTDRSVALTALSPEERGQKWATDFGCLACHTVDGSVAAGPSWQGLFGRQETLEDGSTVIVDEGYLMESIMDPGAQMVSGFQDIMPKDFESRFEADEAEMLASRGVEIDIAADILAYILSLQGSENQ